MAASWVVPLMISPEVALHLQTSGGLAGPARSQTALFNIQNIAAGDWLAFYSFRTVSHHLDIWSTHCEGSMLVGQRRELENLLRHRIQFTYSTTCHILLVQTSCKLSQIQGVDKQILSFYERSYTILWQCVLIQSTVTLSLFVNLSFFYCHLHINT